MHPEIQESTGLAVPSRFLDADYAPMLHQGHKEAATALSLDCGLCSPGCPQRSSADYAPMLSQGHMEAAMAALALKVLPSFSLSLDCRLCSPDRPQTYPHH